MTDAIVWADKLPDIIRKWILIIPMIIAIIGASTGGYQYFDKQSVIEKKDIEKNKAVHEVAIGFQLAMQPTPKIVTIKQNCGSCGINKAIHKHVENYHD